MQQCATDACKRLGGIFGISSRARVCCAVHAGSQGGARGGSRQRGGAEAGGGGRGSDSGGRGGVGAGAAAVIVVVCIVLLAWLCSACTTVACLLRVDHQARLTAVAACLLLLRLLLLACVVCVAAAACAGGCRAGGGHRAAQADGAAAEAGAGGSQAGRGRTQPQVERQCVCRGRPRVGDSSSGSCWVAASACRRALLLAVRVAGRGRQSLAVRASACVACVWRCFGDRRLTAFGGRCGRALRETSGEGGAMAACKSPRTSFNNTRQHACICLCCVASCLARRAQPGHVQPGRGPESRRRTLRARCCSAVDCVPLLPPPHAERACHRACRRHLAAAWAQGCCLPDAAAGGCCTLALCARSCRALSAQQQLTAPQLLPRCHMITMTHNVLSREQDAETHGDARDAHPRAEPLACVQAAGGRSASTPAGGEDGSS